MIGDFENLISHLSDNNQTQMVKFINEMLESSDKFKAAATTLEVVKNPQKYISIKNLTNLELEDLISTAEGAGKYRFDIKWSAKIYDNNGIGAKVSIFVDTKNYSSASNMFKDLKQFKAYLREINDFDQLYIIQQGGRGVTREQIINRLKNVLNKDNNMDEIFKIIWDKPELRKSMFGEISDDYIMKARVKILFQEEINNKTSKLYQIILTTHE